MGITTTPTDPLRSHRELPYVLVGDWDLATHRAVNMLFNEMSSLGYRLLSLPVRSRIEWHTPLCRWMQPHPQSPLCDRLATMAPPVAAQPHRHVRTV